MPQYIHDNTEDEFTHFNFINAYLVDHSMQPANLDEFRTLPSSKATGARQIGRLTNLTQLSVDTSWWTRYRSRTQNPDFGDTFPQAVPGLFMSGQFPAIPRSDDDLKPANHLQAIANTAGFHFCHDRTRGHQSLPVAGAAGHSSGGVAHPAEYRPDEDDALSNLKRQGGQCASADRPHRWIGVSRPERVAI